METLSTPQHLMLSSKPRRTKKRDLQEPLSLVLIPKRSRNKKRKRELRDSACRLSKKAEPSQRMSNCRRSLRELKGSDFLSITRATLSRVLKLSAVRSRRESRRDSRGLRTTLPSLLKTELSRDKEFEYTLIRFSNARDTLYL